MKPQGPLLDILELARWAPSGDNTQPWRFEVRAQDHVAVHCHDTRADTVYDLDGHPSQISVGALLETMRLAATGHGLRADAVRRPDSLDERPVFDVRLVPDATVRPSELIGSIVKRSVQRRAMRTRPLSEGEKRALEDAAGAAYSIGWIEGRAKFKAARLMYDNARLRLTMPEAFEVHRRIIDWGTDRSPDKVPDRALGVDPGTLVLMKWAMVNWKRMSTINTLMGTWAPRLQMDLIPGVACAAHFVLKARRAPQGIDDYIEAGRAVQRFWLTLTHLGLYMQPEMTPLIFSKYVRENRVFTQTPGLHEAAARLRAQAEELVFAGAGHPVYMGRVGAGPAPRARSERQPIERLLLDSGAPPA
jgi:nitroreductase